MVLLHLPQLNFIIYIYKVYLCTFEISLRFSCEKPIVCQSFIAIFNAKNLYTVHYCFTEAQYFLLLAISTFLKTKNHSRKWNFIKKFMCILNFVLRLFLRRNFFLSKGSEEDSAYSKLHKNYNFISGKIYYSPTL